MAATHAASLQRGKLLRQASHVLTILQNPPHVSPPHASPPGCVPRCYVFVTGEGESLQSDPRV